MLRLLAGGVAVALVLAGGVSGTTATPEAMKALGIKSVNTPAPDVRLPALNGSSLALKDLKGKVVLVNFWATWCLPCQYEMPLMEKLYQAYKARGFVVVAISLDQEGKPVVEPFVKEKKLTYPVLLDSSHQGARQFGIVGLPATFLIGPDGFIKGMTYGPKEWDGPEARALIESLLRTAKGSKG
jgi:peroxiredoxin